REYLLAHGYDVTRKLRQPPRQFDGSISTYADRKNDQTPTLANESAPLAALAPMADSAKQTVSEYAQKVEQGLKASPEIIATEYARADYANKQVLADAGALAGKIGNKLDAVLYPPAPLKETDSFKQSPEQLAFVQREHQKRVDEYERAKQSTLSGENTVKYLTPRLSVADTVKAIQANVKQSGASSPEAITAAVFDAFAALPNPAPLPDVFLDRIADKMAEKNAEKAIPITAPSVPFHQQQGATGIHNPVLGTAEEHYTLPLSTVVDPFPRGLLPVVDHGQQTTETTADHGQQTTAAALEKVAELEQKLAIQADEMAAKQREVDRARQRLQANAQAKLNAEREERNRAEAARELEIRQREETTAHEARQRAEVAAATAARELEIRQREETMAHEARQRETELRQRAEAAATVARELAAAAALAEEKAERGALTDEQIELATAVVRAAITEGHIQKVGIPQVSPLFKEAGLPTNAKAQRALYKLAGKTLEAETLLIQNPDKGVGQPLYLIA
ncbi:MAG: hypothetical protein BWK73_30700, partial [Thiothrix lacustris]